jgi:hypothetical protein
MTDKNAPSIIKKVNKGIKIIATLILPMFFFFKVNKIIQNPGSVYGSAANIQ